MKELIFNQSGKPFACNFTKSKIPLEEYFKDFTFFLRAYIKITRKYNYDMAL